MGKSPETVPAKLLKVRENKLRLAASRQGLRLVKLHRDGVRYALDRGRGDWWAPPGSRALGYTMTLDEVAQILRDRMSQLPGEN
jgi:hypothetical protein